MFTQLCRVTLILLYPDSERWQKDKLCYRGNKLPGVAHQQRESQNGRWQETDMDKEKYLGHPAWTRLEATTSHGGIIFPSWLLLVLLVSLSNRMEAFTDTQQIKSNYMLPSEQLDDKSVCKSKCQHCVWLSM